jgi:hypothetical protein
VSVQVATTRCGRARAISNVDVGLPPHELATQQVHAEEKPRKWLMVQ